MNKILQTTICGVTTATLALMPLNVYAMLQDETVYAKLQANGTQDYITVTKHLLNDAGTSELFDKTTLKNIENINGFEGYVLDNDSLTWEANGGDIYYTGETEQKLPVTVEVIYKLDGEEKTLDEILGKSGKVEITLKYHNSSKVGDLYTPFVVAMATTLPENSVKNASVTNGKVISNGRNLAVAAVAAPGLYESLQLDELKDLDTITLSYETENFELNDIYSVVTPKILDENDLKIFDEVDKLSGDAQKLSDSSKELVKGTRTLRNGVQELRNAVASAQKQLSATGNLLDEKTLDKIADTAANAARRKVAAQQDTIRAQIHAQVMSLPELKQLDSLKDSLTQLAPTLIEQKTAAIMTQKINENVEAVCKSGAHDCTNDTVKNAIVADVTAQVEAQKAAIKAEVQKEVMAQMNINISVDAIEEKMFQSTYNSLRSVAAQTASETARSVATQVADSIQEGLGDKLTTLMSEMLKGIDKLLDGADELTGGMEKFDHEGIQKLNNAVNGKIKNTSNKVQRLLKLADDYNNFSGIADGVEGETKFILMIDGKKK